jgi:cysteinyl-tRNA synthetase
MKIYNTLSRSIEEFSPINPPNVGLYSCGPTVYDFPHIGNLRSFLLSDLLQRVLELNNFKVKSIQNITDIDDKIINRAKERNISISDLSNEYEKYFLEDIKKLNIKPKDSMPHATAYIEKMQNYIKVLLEKGFAYQGEDRSVYFDISKFKD